MIRAALLKLSGGICGERLALKTCPAAKIYVLKCCGNMRLKSLAMHGGNQEMQAADRRGL